MKINALLWTDEYRGDHAADLFIAVEPDPGETVEDFTKRLIKKPADRLELRLIFPRI